MDRFPALARLGILAGMSCAPTAPSAILPLAAVPLAAPATYAEWFQRTRACSGLDGSLDAIQWYVVPGVDTFATDRGPKVGMWRRNGAHHTIVLAGNWKDHEMVVRHEMLHSLLGQAGHPDAFFSDRCPLTWETWPEP